MCVCVGGYTINIYSWHGKVLKIVYGVIVIFYEPTLLHSSPPTPLWAEMPSPAPGTGFQSFIQYIIALCIHPPAYTPTPSPFDGANTLRKGWRHFRNDIWMRNGVVYGGVWGEEVFSSSCVLFSSLTAPQVL